jgi:hypothetical protein
MYLFLLAFGAVLSVAGVVLTASGLSVRDHSFDATLVTPGFVAIVGGLLLVGLGFALRVLQRIELALATRPPMPRATRIAEPAEAPKPAAVAEPPSEPARIPFPLKISRLPQTAPVGAPAAPAPAAEKRVEELPQKFPSIARGGPAPLEEIEPAPRPFAPFAVDDAEESSAENVGPFVPRTLKARNGAAPAPKVSTRLDASARAPLVTERPKSPAFDALWPKGPRPRRIAAQAAPMPETMPEIPAVAPPPVIEEQGIEPASVIEPAAAPEEVAEPVTVLKSGVVDGMAYTLYSDGSIEAQLPQGLLRFGSIAELRAHIEQDS